MAADTKFTESDNPQKRDQAYNNYVKEVTPVHNCFAECIKAFVTGGIICTIGQILIEIYKGIGIEAEQAALWTTISLVLLSVILTGLNIYPSITKWGGAGSLVPITGFANSVAAAAIEYKKEGWVFGVGCKIFTIAGPVILYGIVSSWLLGVVYWIFKLIGIV
ncbi:MAG: SpoVA/SpoVAEb family sporulation membrane protein [Clostridia bacterium]|nr:SpoVA/SpoVAEb family sporulation membrane protein [Clostridia bacterium]